MNLLQIIKTHTNIIKLIILLMTGSIFGQTELIPRSFTYTDEPNFNYMRTHDYADSLTHKIGFSQGYSVLFNAHKLPSYCDNGETANLFIDMDNDGIWEYEFTDYLIRVVYNYTDDPEIGMSIDKQIKVKKVCSSLQISDFGDIPIDPVYPECYNNVPDICMENWDSTCTENYYSCVSSAGSDFIFDVTIIHAPEVSYESTEGDLMVGFIDGTLDRPLLIVEGFDPLNSMWPSDIFQLTEDLVVNSIQGLDMGYDIFYLNFVDGATYLQNNAMSVLGALMYLKNLDLEFPTRVIGVSMGGVCSRYALAFAEDPSNNIDHGCDMFVSYDSPQIGAHVSTLLQQYIANMDMGTPILQVLQATLQTPAAKQLMRYNVYDAGETSFFRNI